MTDQQHTPDAHDAITDDGDGAEDHAEDQPLEQGAPTGGDDTTADQLDADNGVEADTLKSFDPDAAPA